MYAARLADRKYISDFTEKETMPLPIIRRYSLSLSVIGMLLLAVSIYVAYVNYPLHPISRGDSSGLALVVIFPLAIGAGLLFAGIVRREWVLSHGSVLWVLLYPLGACVGVSIPAAWLVLSPNYSATLGTWYKLGVLVGGVVGVIGEMWIWNRNQR